MTENIESNSNIVTMEDGSSVEFGKNGKVITSYDVESGVIEYKVVSGEILRISLDDIPVETNREAMLAGYAGKIKSTLAPFKPTITPAEAEEGKITLAQKIQKEIDALKAGKFVTRTTDSGVELDTFLQAWAYVNATGKILTPSGAFDIPANAILIKEDVSHWANVNDPKVISEVTETWKNLSKEAKSSEKKNTFVRSQERFLEDGSVTL